MKKQAYTKPQTTIVAVHTETLLGTASFSIDTTATGSNDVFGDDNTINSRQHHSLWDDDE